MEYFQFNFKIIFFTLLIFLVSGSLVQAQEPIVATSEAQLLPELPRRALFTLEATSDAGEFTEARVFFQPVGSGARISEPVEFEPAAELALEQEWNMQRNNIPPGTKIEYFWRLTDSAGNTFDTPKQQFAPLDPRFDWQTIEDEELSISWYDGDQEWGQKMFDTGKEALAQLEERLGADITSQVRLVAFGNKSDFGSSFATMEDWVGGQAFSDLGVTVQNIEYNSDSWMRTVLFHELSHLVLHQVMEGSIVPVPAWMNEGLAMYNEPVSRSNTSRMVEAAQTGELLPFSYLQGNFGSDGQEVNLAYMQSELLVRYLIEECGQDGFRQVFQNMTNNTPANKAIEEACGYNDKELYNNWRQTLPNAPNTEENAPATEEGSQSAPAVESNNESEGISSFLIFLIVGGLCFIGLLVVAIAFVVMRLLRQRTPNR